MGKIAYRRAAPDWVHPKHVVYGKECDQPLKDGTKLLADQAYWDEAKHKWDLGFVHIYDNQVVGGPEKHVWAPKSVGIKSETMEEYYGARPVAEDYSPAWTPEQATAWQVYEEVTPGTPISVVYPNLDTMADTIAKECGHGFQAMRNKILATLEHGWWYIPVSAFEPGGTHYGRQFQEVV